MQEELKKNFTPHQKPGNNSMEKTISEKIASNFGTGFVLLSKVAKEKKYAQEYLGLLARRGDIGSVRIGKRWYTTWAWFEEFLENGQKPARGGSAFGGKKVESVEEVSNVKIQESVKIEAEKIVMKIGREERISVAVKTKKFEMPVRKNIAGGIGMIRGRGEIGKKIEITHAGNFQPVRKSQFHPQLEAKFKNVSVEKKNRYAVPYQEIKFKKKADIFSPDFAGEENMQAPIFPRFAFAASFAIMIFLLVASGYFVWSGGLLAKGTVAGASDERNVGFSGITSGGNYVLVSAGDKIKEALSVSRVMVAAAKEKSINNN